MSMHEEALAYYDDLESHFMKTMQEQGTPWFKNFGATDPGDDSEDFVNLSRKAYRENMANGTISIFDFRIYLITRQIQLLYKMSQPLEICRRTKIFVTLFSKTIEKFSVCLAEFIRILMG